MKFIVAPASGVPEIATFAINVFGPPGRGAVAAPVSVTVHWGKLLNGTTWAENEPLKLSSMDWVQLVVASWVQTLWLKIMKPLMLWVFCSGVLVTLHIIEPPGST